MTHRHPLDPPNQHHAAETLGRMEADGLLPEGEAAKTMAAIVKEARKNAPTVDPKGLRARLVWSARDAKEARTLENIRRERDQERQLSDAATDVLAKGGTEADAGRAMLALAKTMNPPPPVALGEAALRRARWRVRHGK